MPDYAAFGKEVLDMVKEIVADEGCGEYEQSIMKIAEKHGLARKKNNHWKWGTND